MITARIPQQVGGPVRSSREEPRSYIVPRRLGERLSFEIHGIEPEWLPLAVFGEACEVLGPAVRQVVLDTDHGTGQLVVGDQERTFEVFEIPSSATRRCRHCGGPIADGPAGAVVEAHVCQSCA